MLAWWLEGLEAWKLVIGVWVWVAWWLGGLEPCGLGGVTTKLLRAWWLGGLLAWRCGHEGAEGMVAWRPGAWEADGWCVRKPTTNF